MQESIEEKKSSDLWRNNDHWRICDRTCSFPFYQNTSGYGFSHPIWQHADPSHLSSRRNDRFAIVEGYFSGDHYETRVYKTEEYIAVSSAHHTFSKPVHNLRDLTSERLLIREHGSGTRAILTKTLALKICLSRFRHLVEIENIHTIVTLLKEDCGISFLYKSAVEQELNEGMLVQIPLSDFMIMHDFTFLWNKNSIFSQEYDAVFKELRGAVAK